MASEVNEIAVQASENITENNEAITGRISSTSEGMVLAYGSLIIMAILPIFFGSYRAVRHHKEQQQQCKKSGEQPDTMSRKEAAIFPFISSITLVGLYVLYKSYVNVFQIFAKEFVNQILAAYFFFLGILALCHLTSPLISSLVPAAIPKTQYHISFTKGEGDKSEHIINYKFNLHDIVCLICCSLVGTWYLLKKHWIANNLFGIAFAINGVELLHVNNVPTGCILLCGLLFYDAFWVFGTDVMVTVARSFEVPIKLVFPQDILEKGLTASNFAMLGLGDIVLPGIFIALLLRFDNSLSRKTNVYFYSTFFAYFMGLLATMLIMHLFNHAQPALLYLVPACLGTPVLLALAKGDLKALFSYEDHPVIPKQTEETAQTQVETKKDT
ncbi:minor histocompatibility antigen H13 isoform X1 [Bombus vosnesenskii]|uniref:Minor histocompatibility antigen H13 isoform X1 n=2 Tax=Pyrobombus TaxID=144703 RepID=A0A6J3JZE0_9HYME|nr:minor histocompatibility antigen H13 isoform X1 [Bombus vancouverensis nearcticus]XP_033315847.1 minor histocompatibility antigen H13 isoform X1 [Bombus bifarius]XP_033345530.1 minor histocompatibility antigen H13 isoform X1 [Bombus vosnesenskii]